MLRIDYNNPVTPELAPDASASERTRGRHQNPSEVRPYYSIPELAERWRCSRGSVYNRIRGEMVVDFAAKGKKGHKLVPLAVVLKIERASMRILR